MFRGTILDVEQVDRRSATRLFGEIRHFGNLQITTFVSNALFRATLASGFWKIDEKTRRIFDKSIRSSMALAAWRGRAQKAI